MVRISRGRPCSSALMSALRASVRRSVNAITRSILGFGAVIGAFLSLKQLARHGLRKSEPALGRELLAVFVEQEGPEHRFAFAAAELAVGRNAFEHLPHEFGDEHGF